MIAPCAGGRAVSGGRVDGGRGLWRRIAGAWRLLRAAAVPCGAAGAGIRRRGGQRPAARPASAGPAGTAAKRPWPDSTAKTLILADQLPDGMSAAQRQFVVGHMVGTQKLTLAESQPLRALAPNFLVLHYHLAIWQSAPSVTFIVDGMTWGNDYPTVTTNESWFWHNQAGMRVAAIDDGKLLMNLGDSGLRRLLEVIDPRAGRGGRLRRLSSPTRRRPISCSGRRRVRPSRASPAPARATRRSPSSAARRTSRPGRRS